MKRAGFLGISEIYQDSSNKFTLDTEDFFSGMGVHTGVAQVADGISGIR